MAGRAGLQIEGADTAAERQVSGSSGGSAEPEGGEGGFVLLGTRQAGKTYFLAALYRELISRGDEGFVIRPTSASRDVFNEILAPIALQNRPPEATDRISQFEYEIQIPRRRRRGPFASDRRMLIRATDVPGEAVLPGSSLYENELKRIYDAVANNAAGVLWLIDPDPPVDLGRDRSTAPQMIAYDVSERLLWAAQEHGNQSPVVIGVTKMDMYPEHFSRGAEGARDLFIEKYGDLSNELIMANLADRPVAFVNVSSFGFLTGEDGLRHPNCEATTAEGTSVVKLKDFQRWKPENIWASIQRLNDLGTN